MKRIGIASIWHETNAFAAEHNDQLDAITHTGQDIFTNAHPRNFLGGFLEAATRHDIEFVPILEARFAHGGLIHAGVYDHYVEQIVDSVRRAGRPNAR